MKEQAPVIPGGCFVFAKKKTGRYGNCRLILMLRENGGMTARD